MQSCHSSVRQMPGRLLRWLLSLSNNGMHSAPPQAEMIHRLRPSELPIEKIARRVATKFLPDS